MKILITGGVKSGKSRHAENRALKMANGKTPVYLAATELHDKEMEIRIMEHRNRRGTAFQTIEEPLRLSDVLGNTEGPVLIECMTMWLNNTLHHNYTEKKIFAEIDQLLSLECDVVFVLNEVGLGIIPDNPLARKFADLSGRISQKLAEACDEVNFCVAGNVIKIK
ncbi:MAG: Bifunctional adenosylcobalamin biosynthesis protein CobP [Deltaproteobacteria bacterium]|jgi:adenosylcobinamide kinase/adenosylcobinamide-phosphate guanylyltransferase|nr:Bifunctional adenosylcobalamin biosynthesis protein CobP [Deltaproteobacteria bacterium]